MINPIYNFLYSAVQTGYEYFSPTAPSLSKEKPRDTLESMASQEEGYSVWIKGFFSGCKTIFFGLHDLLFKCFSTDGKTSELEKKVIQERFPQLLTKWFPEEITLYPNHDRQTMIQDFQAMEKKDFQFFMEKFFAPDKTPENITEESFVKNHILKTKTLSKEAFKERPHLIRCYGLHQRNLKDDLNLLPKEVLTKLMKNIAGKDSLDDFLNWLFPGNLHQLEVYLRSPD